MKKTVLILLILTFAFISRAQRNVIIIIADDLSTDYCGFYEDYADTASLPHISTLLSQGVRFQNAMSNPLCSATRAGIFTGRYSFRRAAGLSVGAGYLDTSEITIPRLLNIYDPNIAKAQMGKFHLQLSNPDYGLLNPNGMGYDYYAGNLDGGLPSYFNWTKVANGVESTITNYATVETANDAIAWIKSQQANNPFFLWVAFNAGHSPYHLPAAGLYSDTTLSGTQADINAHTKKYYKATLEAMDHEIGRLFDSLQVLNKLDSTDIIFIGDNGNSKKTAQITDNSRAKGTIYQYGVHVPFIIWGPSIVNPGRVSSALVNTADLFSTILELMGDNTWQSQIPVNKPVDSKSLMPIILNTVDSVRPWAFTEIFQGVCDSLCGKAMRNMDYKLLNFDYGHQEFYNLAIDPAESNNLLTGTLSPNEIANYNYLCTEMNNLTGTGNYCNPGATPTITITAGATAICAGTSVTFNSTVTNGGVSPTYQWKKNGINVGTNSSTYSDNLLTNGNLITCFLTTATLATATSNPVTMAVSTTIPAKPGSISGAQYNLCNAANQTYSVSGVNNATSYIWSVPANATLVSGQGTNSIIISYTSLFKSGVISVQSSNYCGVSALRTRYVYAKTTTPGVITGPNSVCANQQNLSYSIVPVVGATTYKWTLPMGSSITSGSGTTSIVVKFGINAGTITVLAKNACASSLKSTLPIAINCRMKSDDSYYQNGLNVINPFTDKIIFTVTSDMSNATVSLVDLTGREICNWKNVTLFENEQQQLSTDNNIPVGIYLLTIKNSEVKWFSKISRQ